MTLEMLISILIGMVYNWEEAALESIRNAERKVFIPCYMTMCDVLNLLDRGYEFRSSNGPKEKAYPSWTRGLQGRNLDGSRHKGFTVIDPITREILDIVDINGESVLKGSYRHGENLSAWMGWFVIVKNDGWLYRSIRCRCPMIAFDVFLTSASAKAASTSGEVKRITPELVRQFGPTGRLISCY